MKLSRQVHVPAVLSAPTQPDLVWSRWSRDKYLTSTRNWTPDYSARGLVLYRLSPPAWRYAYDQLAVQG